MKEIIYTLFKKKVKKINEKNNEKYQIKKYGGQNELVKSRA